jgi:hypothetical protein
MIFQSRELDEDGIPEDTQENIFWFEPDQKTIDNVIFTFTMLGYHLVSSYSVKPCPDEF